MTYKIVAEGAIRDRVLNSTATAFIISKRNQWSEQQEAFVKEILDQFMQYIFEKEYQHAGNK